MKHANSYKLNAIALANTFALIDLILHPIFHIWGWYFPGSYEKIMSEFVIGLSLKISDNFTPKFFIYWLLEALAFWLLGFAGAKLYNALSDRD